MTRSFLFVGIIAIAAATVVSSPHGATETTRILHLPDVTIDGVFSEQLESVYVHFAPPELEGRRRVKLWATHYSIPRVHPMRGEGSVALLDMKGNELGPKLSPKDFCRAAMEGTVAVLSKRGKKRLYDFDGVADSEQYNCREFFPRNGAIGKSRFKYARAVHGSGAGGRSMVPYRSIAVDRRLIPLGSVLYVPSARGAVVTLDNGETQIHDGYFYAADVGGAIDGNHVDVFIGYAPWNPFSFVKSRPAATFDAYLVEEPLVREVMAEAHAPAGDRILSRAE